MDDSELEANAIVVQTEVGEGDRSASSWVFPLFVVLTMTIIWAIYLYGVLFIIDKNDLNLSLSSPLSPPLRGWYFYTVTSWPSCSDVRDEHARLFTYQFIHANPMHIIGNTIAALSYGVVFNMYMGFWVAGVVYVLAIFMGGLGHAFVWPFKGLIGCSPGVYGLMGGCWVLLFCYYRRLDPPVAFVLPFALVAQLVGDVVAYMLFYSSAIRYASHFFGYVTDILVTMAWMLLDCPRSPVSPCWRWFRTASAFLGLAAFAIMATVLIQHYVTEWPPAAPQERFLHNTDMERSTCCAQLFAYAADNGVSVSTAKSVTYCRSNVLYPL